MGRTTTRTSSRSFTVGLPGFLVSAWLFMLGMGVWHGGNHAVPTIGYWPALLIFAGVNPAHLEAGTQADNVQDMVDRGRGHWQKSAGLSERRHGAA